MMHVSFALESGFKPSPSPLLGPTQMMILSGKEEVGYG